MWQIQYLFIVKPFVKKCQSLTMPEMNQTELHTFKTRWSGFYIQFQISLQFPGIKSCLYLSLLFKVFLVSRTKNDFTQNLFVCLILDHKNNHYSLLGSDEDVWYMHLVEVSKKHGLQKCLLWNPNSWGKDGNLVIVAATISKSQMQDNVTAMAVDDQNQVWAWLQISVWGELPSAFWQRWHSCLQELWAYVIEEIFRSELLPIIHEAKV